MSPGFYFQFVACLENVINNARPYNSNIESRHLPSSPDPTQPSRNPHPFGALLSLLDLTFSSLLSMNEFGSEIARAAAGGMCRPGWQETKPFFETASSSSKAKWKAYTVKCTVRRRELHRSYHTVVIVRWRRELLAFPWEESF